MVRGQHGYGFNLRNDKAQRGQFVRAVDAGSAADDADLRPGDRLVEVRPRGSRHAGAHTQPEEARLAAASIGCFSSPSDLLHLR